MFGDLRQFGQKACHHALDIAFLIVRRQKDRQVPGSRFKGVIASLESALRSPARIGGSGQCRQASRAWTYAVSS